MIQLSVLRFKLEVKLRGPRSHRTQTPLPLSFASHPSSSHAEREVAEDSHEDAAVRRKQKFAVGHAQRDLTIAALPQVEASRVSLHATATPTNSRREARTRRQELQSR